MSTKKVKVTVVKDPENEVPFEVLEQAVVNISNAVRKLNATRLSRRALIVLIQDAGRALTKSDVENVLDAIQDLERLFIVKKK